MKAQRKAWAYKIGRRVVAMRDKKHWNQQALADAAGLSRKTVSDLENGTRNAGVMTLAGALIALDVDIWQLFGGASAVAPKRPIEHEALHDMLDRIIATKDTGLITHMRSTLTMLSKKS